MLYILNYDYLKILNEDEMKDFVVIHFGQYFKFTKRKLCSKLNEDQNLRKVVEHFISFSQHLMK